MQRNSASDESRPARPNPGQGPLGAGGRVPCEDIETMLFDYMAHELGGARSELVREHLRKCRRCQDTAAEIDRTLGFLRAASIEESAVPPAHLSRERRERIAWSLTHPVRDWIAAHHVLVSLLAAAVLIAAAIVGLSRLRVWKERDRQAIPVRIGGQAPAADRAPGANGGGE